MEQRYRLLFVISLWCALLAGAIGAALLLFAEREQRVSERENRYLAGFPAFSTQAVLDGSFMTGFEEWLSDGFFGREAIVRTSSSMLQRFSLFNAEDQMVFDEDMQQAVDEDMMEADAADDDLNAAAADAPDDLPEDLPDGLASPPAGDDLETAYTFWRVDRDGKKERIYTFPKSNVEAAAATLNAYRAALPADGTLHFAQVPYPQIAKPLHSGEAVGWGCDMEAALQSLSADGVFIHSTTSILEKPLLNKQYVYFRTDHHWAPFGAYLVAAAMMEAQGIPAVSYNDFRYTIKNQFGGSFQSSNPGVDLSPYADTLALLHPAAPTTSLVLSRLTEAREVTLIGYESLSYMAFLHGTLGPWRRILTGFHTGRNALVITDSYGNVFAPYLLPYFDEVHMVDLRRNYFSEETAGATVREYIGYYGITDIYVLLSTASSINAAYMRSYMLKYLD